MSFAKAAFIVIGFAIFLVTAFTLFEPGNDPTGFFAYTPSIAVINHDNSMPLNSNLRIDFITRGTNDLAVSVLEGDASFIGVGCGNKMTPVAGDKKLEYKSYSCKEQGHLSAKMLSKEVILEISFGNSVQQVRNVIP